MKLSLKNLSEELLLRGIKPSYQRIKVLEYLKCHQNHPTVEQIFNDLQQEIPTLSKSTVYNTLNVFVKVNLIRVITIEDNETRYDIITENHGHFKCELCDLIYNFSINIDAFSTNELENFIVKDKNVYFKGVCPECLSKNKN